MDTLFGFLHLILRGSHIGFAIYWLGTTWYLGRMAREMQLTPDDQEIFGHSYGVHGGRTCEYRYLRYVPEGKKLLWFKYASLGTWASGLLLLLWNYWPTHSWTGQMVEAFGFISGGTLYYHFIWARIKPGSRWEYVGIILSYGGLIALTAFYQSLLGNLAANYHVAATITTVMVIDNVWLIIIPTQKRMLAEPNQDHAEAAARAQRGTKHNTYMAGIVLLLMLSVHEGALYFLNPQWLNIIWISALGWVMGHIIRKWI